MKNVEVNHKIIEVYLFSIAATNAIKKNGWHKGDCSVPCPCGNYATATVGEEKGVPSAHCKYCGLSI